MKIVFNIPESYAKRITELGDAKAGKNGKPLTWAVRANIKELVLFHYAPRVKTNLKGIK